MYQNMWQWNKNKHIHQNTDQRLSDSEARADKNGKHRSTHPGPAAGADTDRSISTGQPEGYAVLAVKMIYNTEKQQEWYRSMFVVLRNGRKGSLSIHQSVSQAFASTHVE